MARLTVRRRELSPTTSPSGGRSPACVGHAPVGIDQRLLEQRARRGREMRVHQPDRRVGGDPREAWPGTRRGGSAPAPSGRCRSAPPPARPRGSPRTGRSRRPTWAKSSGFTSREAVTIRPSASMIRSERIESHQRPGLMVHAVGVDRDRAADGEDVGRLHRLDREARMDGVLDVVPGRARADRHRPPRRDRAGSRSCRACRASCRRAGRPGRPSDGARPRARPCSRAAAHKPAPPRRPPRCADATTPATGVRLRQLASLTVPPLLRPVRLGHRGCAGRAPGARKSRQHVAAILLALGLGGERRHVRCRPAATKASTETRSTSSLALHLLSPVTASAASSAARKPFGSSICGIWPTPGKRLRTTAPGSSSAIRSPCAIGVTVSASPQIRCDAARAMARRFCAAAAQRAVAASRTGSAARRHKPRSCPPARIGSAQDRHPGSACSLRASIELQQRLRVAADW